MNKTSTSKITADHTLDFVTKGFSPKRLIRIFTLMFLFLNIGIAKSQDFYQQVDNMRKQKHGITTAFRTGIYQMTKDSNPLKVDGQNIYYLLNDKGVILIGMGKSTKNAFYDISGGIKSGRINSGTYVYDSTFETFNFKIGKANTKSSWKYDNTEGSIKKNSDNSTKLVFVESIQ
jgi:hypothetical protein